MKNLVIVAFGFLFIGCAKQSDLDNARNQVAVLEQQLVTLRESAASREESLQTKIDRLESENENMNASLSIQFSQKLSIATNTIAQQNKELADYRAYFERQKEMSLAAENKKREMLDNIKQASQQPNEPFRVFDILYIGNQVRNGTSDTYGRFTIRNYTDKKIEGIAYSDSHSSNGTKFVVPPNSKSEPIYLRTQKNSEFTVKCNLGKKTYNWVGN